MGLDSIPFEEPELFRARSGLPALPGLAEKEHSSLELRLDSQDLMDGSPDQVSLHSCCHPADLQAACLRLAAPPPFQGLSNMLLRIILSLCSAGKAVSSVCWYTAPAKSALR